MTAPFRVPFVSYLDHAIETVRPVLADRSIPVGERLRDFWAAVVAARDLAASDVIKAEFVQLADDVGLAADLGRNAREDIEHVIRWALRNENPFN